MPPDISVGALRVQVIDDCPSTARSLRGLLGLWGHEVVIALSAEEGLDLATTFRPDVVLLDLEMPRLHGGQVAQRLRAIPGFDKVIIVAATAAPLEDPCLDGFRDRFDLYIQKPFSLERLESLLRAIARAGN